MKQTKKTGSGMKRVATLCVDILMVIEEVIEIVLKTVGCVRRGYVKGMAWIISLIKPNRSDLKRFDERINDMVEDDANDVLKLENLRDNVKELLSKKSKK